MLGQELRVLGLGWRWKMDAFPGRKVSVFGNDLVTAMRCYDGGGVFHHVLLSLIPMRWVGGARRFDENLA
jgi:hypothetical protein